MYQPINVSADQCVNLTCFDISEKLFERNAQKVIDNYDKALNPNDK